MSELREISVNFINENYPNLFNDLQEAVYSNNYFDIEQKIKQSAMVIEQAGLASSEYSAVFEFSKEVTENEQLRSELSQLDLTDENDVRAFHDILIDFDIDYTTEAIFFAGALAVFYAIAAAVSIAVAAYSLVTKVAYWDITKVFSKTNLTSIDKELFIAEIGVFFTQ